MPLVEQVLQFTLTFIGLIYWPLLYIRLSAKILGKKNTTFSVLFAIAASTIMFLCGRIYTPDYILLMTAAASTPHHKAYGTI